MTDQISCPKCGEELKFAPVAGLSDESRMVFALAASPGEMLSATNAGLALAQFAKLVKGLNKQLGAESEVLVERIETTAEGEIRCHLAVIRFEKAASRKARLAAKGNKK